MIRNSEKNDHAAQFYRDAVEFKRLATELFGEQCKEFAPGCAACEAHKLANLALGTAQDDLIYAAKESSK